MTAAESQGKSLLPIAHQVGGRYEIVRVVGEGGQGVVYEGRCEDGRRVALKVIHRHLLGDNQIFKRFHREAAILKQLEGEHLVKFIDFVEEDGLLIIVVEFVQGSSLEEILKRGDPLEMKTAVEIGLQICAALGLAHAGGVVHRDLKPANVLVEEAGDEGGSLCVRVVDFGLAKVLHGEHMTTGLTEQDMIFGTAEYMAPEQVRGEDADPRSDLYATGVMLYEMAVGSVPFSEKTPLATMTAHLSEEPPPPRSRAPVRGISPALETVILRALSKSKTDRYANARAFAEALAGARERDVVITPRSLEDLDAMTGDTDLSLSTTGLANAKTLPEMAAVVPKAAERTLKSEGVVPAKTKSKEPLAVASTRFDPVPSSRTLRRDRWLWLVVAVVAAIVGVAIGALVGGR